MSMLWMFEKLMGAPQRVEREGRELRKDNEGVEEDATAPPTLRCRACNYEGPELYCPRCLADTMAKVKIKVRGR